MSSIKDIVQGVTEGPGGTSTDSKVVEAAIAGGLLLIAYGGMKALCNMKLDVKTNVDSADLKKLMSEGKAPKK